MNHISQWGVNRGYKMKILKQLGIIIGVCLIGEILVRILPFAFPSSVTSLILIATALITKVIKEKQISESADFLMGNMAIFFVPACIGVLEDLDVLKGQLVVVIVIIIITMIVTFLSACFIAIIVKQIQEKVMKYEQRI